ncbi:MAG: class I SAM-dependent methyltransferase [Methanoregula sp.]|nr:class I SAM-dependent methyltransferase [Methanoregula sp.]
MTPEEFFYNVFEFLPRQGPGCTGATRKAYSYLPPIPGDAKILDIGCGSGTQTRDLAGLTSNTITAVDNHQPFIDAIAAQAQKDGMAGRIRAVCASMDTLPFEPGQFDLIWSEGAIFITGFEQGLRAWKPLVKKEGFIVVSDAVRFEADPPVELMQYWEKLGYPLLSEQERVEQIQREGLRFIAMYRLPEAGWWENFYVPMLARVAELRKTYGNDPTLAAILDSFELEVEMYRKYKWYFGYTFFVMQNP